MKKIYDVALIASLLLSSAAMCSHAKAGSGRSFTTAPDPQSSSSSLASRKSSRRATLHRLSIYHDWYRQYDGGPRIVHVPPDMVWNDTPLPCTASVACGATRWETPEESRLRAIADERRCEPVLENGRPVPAMGCLR